MELIVKAALWARLTLSAAAFFSAIFIRGEAAARSAVRSLVAVFASLNAVFLVLFLTGGKNFPLNHTYDGFFISTLALSVIILLYMNNLKSRAPVIAAIAILIIHSAAGMYGATLEPVMKSANTIPMALLFVAFRDISVMFFAFGAVVAAAELIRPGAVMVKTNRSSDAVFSPVLWGFISFSFCQLFGSLWTITGGWGDVWLWRQSFLFSGAVWIYYGGMLHIRYVPKWPEKLFPALSVFGFVVQLSVLYVYFVYFEVR
jgi:hypothetical protein